MSLHFKRFLRRLLARFQPASRQLAILIAQAHRGEISIEELLSADCCNKRLAPVASVVGEVLLDLKQQRAERAALEQEISDRIANRTDALERKIGSLQVQATRDPLTGLGNRRGLDAQLPRLIANCQQAKTDACLLMIDVDHFKMLNDTLGHPAGDELLRQIGQLIRSTLRAYDHAFRCGGDEFVVILDRCDLKAGNVIGSRLESLVKSLTATLPLQHPPQLSIGIAAISEVKDVTTEALIQMADGRLYAVESGTATDTQVGMIFPLASALPGCTPAARGADG